MSPKVSPPSPHQAYWGTVCGLLSALFYSGTHILLRNAVHVDPVLVSAVKAVPSLILAVPLLIWIVGRGSGLISSWTDVGYIALASLIAHFAGNIVFQWALGVLGMAIGVPVTLGSLLIGSAITGWLILSEPVSSKSAITALLVIISIAVLSFGSDSAATSMQDASGSISLTKMIAGLLGFCLAGFAYSALGVTIRLTGTRGMPIPTTMIISGILGVTLMGGLSLGRLGWPHITEICSEDWATMAGAGICNAFAFLSIITALHLTKLLQVNLLNAAQAAIAAVAGVIIFGEPIGWSLCVGVLLMATAFVYASWSPPKSKSVEDTGRLDHSRVLEAASRSRHP